MASGQGGSNAPKRDGKNAEQPEVANAYAFPVVHSLSEELRTLRLHWDAIGEPEVENAAVLRLDKCIAQMEEMNRKAQAKGANGASSLPTHGHGAQKPPCNMAENVDLAMMQREGHHSELQMKIHEQEMIIAGLKIKIIEAGLRGHPIMKKAERDHEKRTDMLLLMLYTLQDPTDPPSKRIENLERRNAELIMIIREQKYEICALSAMLRR